MFEDFVFCENPAATLPAIRLFKVVEVVVLIVVVVVVLIVVVVVAAAVE